MSTNSRSSSSSSSFSFSYANANHLSKGEELLMKQKKERGTNKCSLCKELGHNVVTCKERKASAKKAEHAAFSSQQGNTRGKKRKAIA